MAEVIHRVEIQASPDKVFLALSTIEGVAGIHYRPFRPSQMEGVR